MSGTTQHLPGLVQAIAPVIRHYGYLAVGGLVMLEDFGVPVPGETALLAAAVFAGLGQLNIVAVGVVALAAAVVGDNIGFLIGHYGGRQLLVRYGRYIFLTPSRLDRAERFLDTRGGWVVSVARFVEGLRQLNGLLAGAMGMDWRRFLFFNVLGAAVWVAVWSTIGYVAADHLDTFRRYETIFVAVAGAAFAGWLVFHLVRRRRHRSGAHR